MREEFGQTEHLIERSLGRGQTALRLWQELSLAVHHLHAETARIRMAVHKSEALREGVVFYHRVGVEQ